MSNYLWPLGNNNAEYMDTDSFLKKRRNVTKHNYYHTVEWTCKPGLLPFNYITNYYPLSGRTEQITASGVFSEDGVKLNPSFCGYNFPDNYIEVHSKARKMIQAREGLRLTKLYYRVNDGKWIELSTDLKNVSFNLSNNKDKIEIKATYQLWTMGNPHSPIPFLWLGNEEGVYNKGKNKLNDIVPVNPGRKHSGIINYSKGVDYNSDWQLQSVNWYALDSTIQESNWAYQNALYLKDEVNKKNNVSLNTWNDTLDCQKFNDTYMNKPPGYYPYIYQYGWNYNYPDYNTNNITNKWWESTYKTRKGVWWVYEKTFTDSYIASGIEEAPAAIPVTDVSLKVLPMEREWTRTKWLDGTKGKLVLTFNGPKSAFVDIYSKQLIYDSEIELLLKPNVPITSGTENTIEIDFTDYPQLYRSKNIAYYVKIHTLNGSDKKYDYTPSDTSYLSLIGNGVHYYNDEPPWITNVKIAQVKNKKEILDPVPIWNEQYEWWLQNNELYQISWSTPKDPDGDIVEYMFLQSNNILDDVSFISLDDYSVKYNRNDDWVLKCKQNDLDKSENVTVKSDYPKRYGFSPHNHALFHLSNDYLKKHTESSKIWIVPHDGKNNNYYYGTKVDLLNIKSTPLTLEVLDNKNDHGEIIVHYKNNIEKTANIKIHTFISNNAHDKTLGNYLGVIYEGQINPGDTKISVSLYDKINGQCKLKRGHYIKYAIECSDLNQGFNPYDKNNWEMALRYHIYNVLPTASTPFLCGKNEIPKNKIVNIAWNKSLIDDNNSASYTLYIAVNNRPELNKNNGTFWINGDQDSNMVTKKFYKSINVGTTLPTKDFPYKLNLTDLQEDDKLEIWITASDKNNSSRYLTGESLFINNSDRYVCTTQIAVSDAYIIDLLGGESIDSNSGFVQVCQINSKGEQGTVKLHAVCKKIRGNQIGKTKVFTNIATWNLNCGEWSPNTKINFKVIFGEEWSNSEVKYYAVVTTNSGVSSYDPTVV